MNKTNTYFRFNLNLTKYSEIVLSLLKIAGGQIIGKKKFAKLLYFYEFDFFEKYEKTSTGETFLKYPMGPLPKNMQEIINELCKAGRIKTISQKSSNGYDIVEYKLVDNSKIRLTIEEKSILDRIQKLYINKTGKELEDISHLQAPWNAVEMYQVINPELSYYRATEF